MQEKLIQPSEETLATLNYDVLARLLDKRLQRFMSQLPGVMGDDDPEAVHDVRVWSRRLQQGLAALFPKPRPGRVRRLRRTLRRVRRDLGEWRDCDVVLQLVARERRRTRSQAKRAAWELLSEHLHEKRRNQIILARQNLTKLDLADFAGRVRKLIERPAGPGSAEALVGPPLASIETAWGQWQSALAQAEESREAPDLHAFRITTKRLRYRIELIHDLGDERAEPLLHWLSELQETLGAWHDRQTLHQAMAEGLARPEFLLRDTGAARTLLAEIEKSRSRQGATVDEFFRLAHEHVSANSRDSNSADSQ